MNRNYNVTITRTLKARIVATPSSMERLLIMVVIQPKELYSIYDKLLPEWIREGSKVSLGQASQRSNAMHE